MYKTYSLQNTKIGDSKGFILPTEFYHDNPLFANVDGWIEVTSDTTAIIKINPPDLIEETEDSLTMRLFLDFALTTALKNRDLQLHTAEMSAAARASINEVDLDE